MTEHRALRIGHLYPDAMNLYGDRGNVLALVQRCAWRGIAVEVVPIRLGDCFAEGHIDILFGGGDQDREQRRVADDLARGNGGAIKAAVEDGLPALLVCGTYQLFGREYRPAEGEPLPGIGVFAVVTKHPGAQTPRCVGNIVADWNGYSLVGFENHGGRTYLEPGTRPLGRVIAGMGNNATDGTEGAIHQNAFGTYLHGSLLPKNPAFTDHLLALALARKYGDGSLTPLDDSLEEAARQVAIRRAKQERHVNINAGARVAQGRRTASTR